MCVEGGELLSSVMRVGVDIEECRKIAREWGYLVFSWHYLLCHILSFGRTRGDGETHRIGLELADD